MSSERRHRVIVSVDDFDDDEIREVLERAATPIEARRPVGPTVGLLFLAPSLRTRVGFAVAAQRLGGDAIDIVEQRWQRGITIPESFEDTLRTVSGMVDLVVARVDHTLDRTLVERATVGPFVNGGDAGGEHPTQALIDLAAIEAEAGPVGSLTLALCGDLGSRSARSMLRLLVRFPPAKLVVIAAPGRAGSSDSLPDALEARTERRDHLDPTEVDVLSMVGLAEGTGAGRLDEEQRRPFTLSERALELLPSTAVILSPMPIIDEIGPAARADPRARHFAQSDRGVAVRAAVLDLLLSNRR